MKRLSFFRALTALRWICVGVLFAANTATAAAAPAALSDAELAQVSGQGFVVLDNTVNVGGLDFSTVTLNADVTLNANFGNIKLGSYAAVPNGTGSDVDIAKLQFGRGNGSVVPSLVQISNPYLQFVFDHTTQQVIGLRLGFGGIKGDVGLQASAISGTIGIDGGPAGMLTATGSRWNTFSTGSCPTPGTCTLANIGDLTAGNGSGPSRDFWISMLSQPVQFPAPASGSGLPTVAQAGAWLNWTDRLAAVNTTGTLSPNAALGH